jgi:heavy metal translocating P-type ATPase
VTTPGPDALSRGTERTADSPRAPARARPARADLAQRVIALGSLGAVGLHVVLRYGLALASPTADLPLFLALLFGGGPLLLDLARKIAHRDIGADVLAGISIVTAVWLGEYLAGTLVVLMLAGGAALERYAVERASAVLRVLANRTPAAAHRREDGRIVEVALDNIAVGDHLVVFPHEICPVDGVVVEGRGVMDESYLTGEPFEIRKTPGSTVLSGAVNGEQALTIRTSQVAGDSRYARIMQVMQETAQQRPRLRRLGDRLGAVYTPVAVAVALAAWVASGDPVRFLAVLVIATPCPLLIAIPVTIIGAISLAARRGIVIKNPAILEQIDAVRTIIFDKTGTLTYGIPTLTHQVLAPGVDGVALLRFAASVEQYSKHPLARAILSAARDAGVPLGEASEISEHPGEGLRGRLDHHDLWLTGRTRLALVDPAAAARLPAVESGLECVLLRDGHVAGLYRFHDAPRAESRSFVAHLGRKHRFTRVLLVSGDRPSEVAYLAREVGVAEVHAGKSPEEKVAIVRGETRRARTLFLGDGINDAPALLAATVGLAFGHQSAITAEAAGAVLLEPSLRRVDELFHISRRMRRLALESAIGGIVLSLGGMGLAAGGLLSPVAGAIAQEVIDLAAVLNALRMVLPPRTLSDF